MDPKGTPTNLLSRLTRLFGDAESEKSQQKPLGASQEEVVDAAALKERIRRKKRDDAIRKMEFNSLRKILRMRHDSVITPRSNMPRPSSFNPISEFSAEVRASTLVKIEEAEAQLSAWWNDGGKPTQGVPLDVDTSKVELADEIDLDFTHYQEPQPSVPADLEQVFAAKPGAPAPVRTLDQPSILEELPAGALDRVLRDAAVVFAEGDTANAQRQLITMYHEVLQEGETSEGVGMALFDLYRYSGDQESFNQLALDFAERFGKSPPEWYSLPDIWKQRNQRDPLQLTKTDRVTVDAQRWVCPATLHQSDLWAYMTGGYSDNGLCSVQWDSLQTIDSDAADLLLEWTEVCARSPLQIQWTGLNALVQALGRKEQDYSSFGKDDRWWRIHMNVLCIANLPEDFENVAIEYCIALEVSPPSWFDPACKWTDAASLAGASLPNVPPTLVPGDSKFGVPASRANTLMGDVLGDAAAALEMLDALARTVPIVSVDCSYLGRVDFSAGSALLNWVHSCHQQNIDVEFLKIPRLVLIFLQMLGLERHAVLSGSVN